MYVRVAPPTVTVRVVLPRIPVRMPQLPPPPLDPPDEPLEEAPEDAPLELPSSPPSSPPPLVASSPPELDDAPELVDPELVP